MSKATREIGFMAASVGDHGAASAPAKPATPQPPLEDRIAAATKVAEQWEKDHPSEADRMIANVTPKPKAPKSPKAKPAPKEPAPEPEPEPTAPEEPEPEEEDPIAAAAEEDDDDAEDLSADEKAKTFEAFAKDLPAEKKLEAFKALGKELGFRVSDDKVAIEERAKFRDEKRQHREGMEKREAQFQQAVQRLDPVLKAIETIEQGDIDLGLKRLTKAITGLERGISELNEEAVAAASGDWSSHKKLQRLQIEQENLKAERERERAELQAARERENVRVYMHNMQQELSQSNDKVLAAMAEDGEFITEVYQLQCKHWDPDEQASIPTPEAAAMVLDRYRKRHEKRAKIFGAPASPTTPSDGSGSPESERPRNGQPPARIGEKARPSPSRKGAPPGLSNRDYYVRLAEEGIRRGAPLVSSRAG